MSSIHKLGMPNEALCNFNGCRWVHEQVKYLPTELQGVNSSACLSPQNAL
jgi:hypothetical protein